MNKLNYLILLIISSHLVIVNCGILGEFSFFVHSSLATFAQSVSRNVSYISVLDHASRVFFFLIKLSARFHFLQY